MNVADLICESDAERRTYRQLNNAKTHAIPVGTLVEIVGDDDRMAGVRLFVVHHGRDCDGTPLYYLSPDPDDTVEERPGFRNPKWVGGSPEERLEIVSK